MGAFFENDDLFHFIDALEDAGEGCWGDGIKNLAARGAGDVGEGRRDFVAREHDGEEGDFFAAEVLNDGGVEWGIDVPAFAVGHEDDHAVTVGTLGQQIGRAVQSFADEGAAPKVIWEAAVAGGGRIQPGVIRLDETFGKGDGLGVEGEREPVDELATEDGEPEGVALTVGDELLDGFHRRIEAPVAPAILGAVVLGHAAGGIEHDLDVVELALHFWRRVRHGVGEEKDGDGQKRGGQAVGAQHQEVQQATARLLAMIEGHGDGLPVPRPLPEGEDDRQSEQAKQLRMLEDHGVGCTV